MVTEILVDIEPQKAAFIASEIERLLNSTFFNHYGKEPYMTVSVKFTLIDPNQIKAAFTKKPKEIVKDANE